MADFTALKNAIQTYIKQNGNEEITGEKLQEILLSMVTTLGDSAINDLVTALNNEVAARQNADGTLQQNITNEETARGNADTALGGRIDDEETARANADTALSDRLGSTITAENTAAEQIGAEAEARAAADTALLELIDGITENIENGYVYAGIATPSSTPATGKVFYLALTAGTYTNFGSTVVSQGINILKYNGSTWALDDFIGIDDTPIPSSNNLIKSGGVSTKLREKEKEIQTIILQSGNFINSLLKNKKFVTTNNITAESTISGKLLYADGTYKDNASSAFVLYKYKCETNKNYIIYAPNTAYSDNTPYSVVSLWDEDTFIQNIFTSPCEPRNYVFISIPSNITVTHFVVSDFGHIPEVYEIDILNREIESITYEGNVKLNTDDCILNNKYISGDTGRIFDHEGWTMYLIPLFGGIKTYSYYTPYPNANYALFVLDKNLQAIKSYGGNNLPSWNQPFPTPNQYGNYVMEVPDNAAYIAFNKDLFSVVNTLLLFNGDEAFIGKAYVSRLNNFPLYTPYENNPFSNLNIAIMGDSITWLGGVNCDGSIQSHPHCGWTEYFKEKALPKSIYSYARSGAFWSHTEDTVYNISESIPETSPDNVIYNQINRLINNVSNGYAIPDVIIIASGTNDAWFPSSRPHAVEIDADTEFTNTNAYITSSSPGAILSVAAAVRYDLEIIKTNFPNCQVFILSPLQSGSIALSRIRQVGQIIEDCAGYLSVPCIRQDKECGIYRAQEATNNIFTYDGTHTSSLGAKMIGYFLYSKIKSLLRDKLQD